MLADVDDGSAEYKELDRGSMRRNYRRVYRQYPYRQVSCRIGILNIGFRRITGGNQ